MRIDTGEKYIGQTINKVKDRWRKHCKPSVSKTSIVNNAILKYGKDAFIVSILQECEDLVELNRQEEFWIKELNTLSPNGYNIKSGGSNSRHSDNTKNKMSKSATGRKHTEESRLKISEAGRNRPPISEETRKKISISVSHRMSSPEVRKKISDTSRNPSLETRKKMSIAGKGRKHTEESKIKMSIVQTGKIISPAHREKISKTKLSKKMKFSQEQIENMLLSRNAAQTKKDELFPPSDKILAHRINNAKYRKKLKLKLDNQKDIV